MSDIGLGFFIALLAAISWAALDALRKRIGNDVPASTAVAALSVFQLPLLAVLIAVGEIARPTAPPWAVIAPPLPHPTTDYIWFLAGSVVLNVAANWLFLRAVQLSPLSLTVPYLSFTPVFTVLLAAATLGQIPTIWGGAGIVVVTLGAFLLQVGDGRNPLRALKEERGSLYMLLVALLWSVTPVLDKAAVDRAGVPVHTAFLGASLFVTFWLGRAIRDRDALRMIREFGRAPVLLFASGCVLVCAMVLQLAAYSFIDVAYVETTKRGVGVVAAVLLGWAAFAESGIRWRLVAALIMATGVAMIILSGQ